MGGWVTDHDCGTAACAAGWMGRDPRMNAVGFTLELQGEDVEERLVPCYRGYTDIDALQVFLGFQHCRNIYHVFGASVPNSFSAVLERLEQAVRSEQECQRRREIREMHG